MADSAVRLDEHAGARKRIWPRLRVEAASAAANEPALASLISATILNHETFEASLSYHLAQKLGQADMNPLLVREVCDAALASDPSIARAAARDIEATIERDPACDNPLQPFLWFKGYAALQSHRVAHWLWIKERRTLAQHIQSRVSELFGVDIHPAAQVGAGVMIDHATGVVIGETAVVGDDCTLLQNATLGGTGKQEQDRHPKLGKGVLVSVGASILGNIRIGDRARIAAGSVVLHPVEADCTVAGVPARPVGKCSQASSAMDQLFETDGNALHTL